MALRPSGRGGAGLSRGPGAVATPAAQAAGVPEAPPGAQSGAAAAELPGVGAALPPRARRPVHPQPGGAGCTDEEGAPENLGRVQLRARGRRISPPCTACCRAGGSKAATASRPCCKGPTLCSPLSPPNGRPPPARPGSPRAAALTPSLQLASGRSAGLPGQLQQLLLPAVRDTLKLASERRK